MPSVVIGGTSFELAGLRLADVRALSRSGCLRKLSDLASLEAWEQMESAAEILAVSINRSGNKTSAEELLELGDAKDLPSIVAAVSEVMQLSGFSAVEAASPNAEGPAAT